METIFPDFKILLESFLFNDYGNENIIQYIDHPFWKRGFASAGGASQSLFSALGILICFFLYTKKKLSLPFSILYILIIFSATIFIGRTGIIFSFFYFINFIFYLIFTFFRYKKSFVNSLLIFSFLFLVLNFSLDQIEFDKEHIEWAFNWFDLDKGFVGNQSYEGAKNHIFLPHNVWHLYFGKGFFEGVDSDYPRSDSGYVKSILSIGIFLSFLFYSIIYFIFFRIAQLDKDLKYFFFLLCFTLLIAEFKEPFLYQNFIGRMIFSYIGFIFVSCKLNFET